MDLKAETKLEVRLEIDTNQTEENTNYCTSRMSWAILEKIKIETEPTFALITKCDAHKL